MESGTKEKLIELQKTVSPSALMVDFPAERFREAPEAEEAKALPEPSEAQPSSDGAKDSAPWYCVLPVILFGASCALIPDSQASMRSALGIWLSAASAVILIIAAALQKVRIRKSPINIAFICCTAALIISYLLSPYKKTALLGAEGSMEGTMFLIACVLIMFCAFNVMRGKAALTASVWTAAAVFAARGVFSVLGYLGKEISRTDIILLSGGACLIFMLLAGQLSRGRFTGSLISIVLWTVLAVFTAAAARTDLISFAASVVATVIILAAVHFRMLRAFAKPAVLLVMAAMLVLTPAWKYWMPQIRAQKMDDVSREQIENFIIEGNTAHILFDGFVLSVKTEAGEDGRITKAEFVSGLGKPLTVSEDKNEPKMYLIDEEPYHSFVRLCIIRNNDTDVLRIETSGFAWDLVSDGSRLYYLNSLGEADIPGSDKPRDPATGCRYLRERQAVRICAQDAFSKYAQYGCGADCFGIVYPSDHVVRYDLGLDASAKTEDPKSLYLLAGIQTGCVTLCAFSAIAVIYAVFYLIRLRKEKSFADGRPERAAVLSAVVCLALAGITNSPKAGTLPLFFVLLGTGLAAEYKK